MTSAPTLTKARADFYARIGEHSMTPLWEVMKGLITPEPKSPAVPALWRYDEVRAFVLEAGDLITAKEAERRVLILENPGLKGRSSITHTLYAGLQLILPGEVAPAHRHTQTALRFVVEGDGAYTAVDGERTTMQPGDFVITPSWTWHDHGNDSDRPMVWMDGLDIPLVQFLDASFAEHAKEDTQQVSKPEGDALARYGQGLMPVDHRVSTPTSPIFNYPYARTREALETMRRTEAWDPHHGLKMKYVNPATGGWAIPTMATCMQLLPEGFAGSAYRSTDGTVLSVVEGKGHSLIGGTRFDWGPRDIFVVPSWVEVRHHADEDAVLFSFSDRPVQEAVGIWRERRSA